MSFKICSATIPFGQTLAADIVRAVECVPANAICGVVVYGANSSMILSRSWVFKKLYGVSQNARLYSKSYM